MPIRNHLRNVSSGMRVEQLRAVDGAQKARQDHRGDQRHPFPEGESGQAEDDDLQEVLRGHAGGMGGDQRLAVVLEELREQHRRPAARSRRPASTAAPGRRLPTARPALGQPVDAGDLRPGQHQDEAAEHQLQQRVGKLHHEEHADDRSDHAAGDEGRRHVHAHECALMPGAAGVGAELHRAVHRDQRRRPARTGPSAPAWRCRRRRRRRPSAPR